MPGVGTSNGYTAPVGEHAFLLGDTDGSTLVAGRARTPAGFAEAYRTFVEAGWVSAMQPASAGGDGLPAVVQHALTELRFASYLPRLVSGEWTGTMNLAEPQAGSDLGAITTTARQNADGTLGGRNAIETVAVEHELGIHASPTCTLQFDGATGHLVGELHSGLAAMFVMMNSARIGVGVQGLAVADRAHQRAARYAAPRVQGAVLGRPAGTPVAEHPDVRRLLLSISSRISAMRATAVLVGDAQDRAEAAGGGEERARFEYFVPVLKSWLTEQAVPIASDALQVHGGAGFVEETGAAQHYRDARILPVYEGTTAIQANDLVGRKTLRDGGATARRVLDAGAERRLSEADFYGAHHLPQVHALAEAVAAGEIT